VLPRIDETLHALTPYSWTSQHHVAIAQAVTQIIARYFYPFSTVEDEGFQLSLQVLDRWYQLPSCKHVFEKASIPL